jgi:hypothetical protein
MHRKTLPSDRPRDAGFRIIPGDWHLPGTAPDLAGALQKAADAPIRPSVAQVACDIGLFSDDASQLDLLEMFQDPTNGD